MDHAGRAGDAFPGPELDVESPAALLLDECGEIALEDEKHLFHFMRVRGIALAGLDVHDREREAARRYGGRVAVLAGAARADETVLRTLIALDLRVFEGGPVGLAVAKARDIARGDFFQRHARELRRARMAGDAHAVLLVRFIVP